MTEGVKDWIQEKVSGKLKWFERLIDQVELFNNEERSKLLEKYLDMKERKWKSVKKLLKRFIHEILVLALIALLGVILA